MDFRILGPLDVVGPDGPIGIDGGKIRALLELLLLHANEVIPGDRLVDTLWGETPSDSAEHAVEVYVSRLRRALGQDRIETHPPGYRIRVDPDELDLHRFEALTAEARAALDADDATQAVGLFHEAEVLWRGPALAELRSLDRAGPEITRLDELRLAATTARIDAMLATGRNADLVPELERLVAEHPFQEGLRAQHMLALYRSGRQVDALDSYQVARKVLEEELGLEPGPALQQLQLAILRQDPELRAASWRRPGSAIAEDTTSAALPGTARRRAPDRRMTAVVLLAGVIVVAGGVAVLLQSMTGGTGVAPSAALATASPLGEQKLLDRIPRAIVGTCTPERRAIHTLSTDANVFCDLPLVDDADDVWYHGFSNLALTNTAFNDIVGLSRAPVGTCNETTASAVGTWEIPDVYRGRLLCYEADGSVWIVWTYDDDHILARARRGGSEAEALYRWWREAKRFLR